MYVCQMTFECIADTELGLAQTAISALLDELRYNGQIIGREFPVVFDGEQFESIVVCPEQSALSSEHNNQPVMQAYLKLAAVGLSQPQIKPKGLESQSDFVDLCDKPSGLILYSTFVQSCSPLRCMEHFAPVPLYKFPDSVRKPLIKWQESHAGCDQIQMNALADIEPHAVHALSDLNSDLVLQGRALANNIEAALNIPVYLYLYRVGGESLEKEQQRVCPSCGDKWLLSTPLFELFSFKCDKCKLVSNISWDWL